MPCQQQLALQISGNLHFFRPNASNVTLNVTLRAPPFSHPPSTCASWLKVSKNLAMLRIQQLTRPSLPLSPRKLWKNVATNRKKNIESPNTGLQWSEEKIEDHTWSHCGDASFVSVSSCRKNGRRGGSVDDFLEEEVEGSWRDLFNKFNLSCLSSRFRSCFSSGQEFSAWTKPGSSWPRTTRGCASRAAPWNRKLYIDL